MRTSKRGKEFIFFHEAGDGSTTGRLHWPKGASGVTLGAGYDMKERTKEAITRDLTSAGVPPDVAVKTAEGAGLMYSDAMSFAKANEKLVKLDVAQQKTLLERCLDYQEGVVQRNAHVHLVQREFDALVSFAGNCAGLFTTAARHIKNRKTTEAMSTILSALGEDDVKTGLKHRRECEVKFYLYDHCVPGHKY